jgi:hypothetical protein
MSSIDADIRLLFEPFSGRCHCGRPGLYLVKCGDGRNWVCEEHRAREQTT